MLFAAAKGIYLALAVSSEFLGFSHLPK